MARLDDRSDDADARLAGTIDDAADVDGKGEAVLNSCSTDGVPLDGNPGEIIRLKAKVNASKGTGSLSGISIFEAQGLVLTCKLEHKRVNTTPAKFAGCPA